MESFQLLLIASFPRKDLVPWSPPTGNPVPCIPKIWLICGIILWIWNGATTKWSLRSLRRRSTENAYPCATNYITRELFLDLPLYIPERTQLHQPTSLYHLPSIIPERTQLHQPTSCSTILKTNSFWVVYMLMGGGDEGHMHVGWWSWVLSGIYIPEKGVDYPNLYPSTINHIHKSI